MIMCASCGARIASDVEICTLCGWPVGQEDHDMQPEQNVVATPTTAASSLAEAPSTPASSAGPFCHMCGWQNPSGARFCSDCGTQLQERPADDKQAAHTDQTPAKGTKKAELPPVTPDASAPEEALEAAEAAPLSAMNVGMLVVAGLLVVAALYMITTFSRRAFPEVEPAAAQAQSSSAESSQQREPPATAVTGDLADRIGALEAEAANLSGEALVAKKREIVGVYASASRPDKAAPVQEEIASLSGTAEDWFSAGHFYYDWMDAQRGEDRFAAASQATAAYEKGLEVSPDNLDIRTALAMAYLNTRAPMQGVQQIRQVLDTDPNHLQGNFYYGVMLMQINRLDQAKSQFEKVKTLVGPESAVYQQADQMLQNLGQ